jgi:hypothetical protein
MDADPYAMDVIRNWKQRLSHATDESEVVLLSRQFLGSLPDSDLVLIAPASPQSLRGADAVAELALRLTQKEMALSWDDIAAGNTLRTIASVLIEASKRLNALAEATVLRQFNDGAAAEPRAAE